MSEKSRNRLVGMKVQSLRFLVTSIHIINIYIHPEDPKWTGTSFYQWIVRTTLYMMNYSFSLINAT